MLLYIYGYRYLSGSYLTIEMKTSVAGYGQVYFDTGLSYQEDESYRFEIRPTSVFEEYSIPLPESNVKSVRFDPLDRRGIFEIKSLAIKTRDEKVIWEGDKLAQQIVPLQQIDVIKKKSVFAGSSTGEDPNFYVKDLVIPENHDTLPHSVLFIVVFTVAMALMGFILFWLINILIRSCRLYLLNSDIFLNVGKSIFPFVKPLFFPLRELSRSINELKRLWDLKWVRYTGLSLFLILWGRVAWSIYSDTGLFWWIGTDFAHYFAQSTALWSGDPSAIYRPEVFDITFQRLLNLYSPNHPTIHPTHVPYLPLYAWLFTPFTLPSPLIGFALWEGINLLALIYLAWRIVQLFPGVKQTWVTLTLLVSFPVAVSLIVSQPQLLLACAIAECYRSLRGERDFYAGLWLALLLFKPQYGILIGLLLIWKRRWAAIAGVIVGGIVVVGGSVLVAGVPTLMEYPTAFTDMAKFRALDAAHMINWRSLVLELRPGIGEREGMMLTQILAFITVFFTALAWRGTWLPRDSRFPARFTLLLLATLLANHHSFNYGAVILILPLAALLAEGQHDLFTGLSVIAGVVLPTLSFTLVKFGDVPWASRILTFSLLALYAGLLVRLWRYNKCAVDTRIHGLRVLGDK